ncbi:MAG TPA: hypothetical protein VGL66_19180 [Caulobacteraceae bacterium]
MSEFQALLLSAAIEAPIAWLLVRLTRWPSRGPLHAALAAAAATAVTHPQLWAAVLWLTPRFGWSPVVVAGEAVVVVVEGLLIAWMAGLTLRHAMLLSLAANSASFGAGLLLTG